jgi:hypothetical protein
MAVVRRGSGSCTSHILSAVATTWLSVHSDCGGKRVTKGKRVTIADEATGGRGRHVMGA